MREFEHGRPDDGYRPLQLIGVIIVALLGFSAFFLSFLLAPLAILGLFYVIFAGVDRSGRASGNNGHSHHDEDEVPPAVEEPAPRVTRAAEPSAYAPARTPAGVGAAAGPPVDSAHTEIPQAPPPAATYPGGPTPPGP